MVELNWLGSWLGAHFVQSLKTTLILKSRFYFLGSISSFLISYKNKLYQTGTELSYELVKVVLIAFRMYLILVSSTALEVCIWITCSDSVWGNTEWATHSCDWWEPLALAWLYCHYQSILFNSVIYFKTRALARMTPLSL